MATKGLLAKLAAYEQYVTFGDDVIERKHYPSGVLALNHIIANNGGKGIPGGTILQLLGEAKHGKSTLSLDFIAQAQKTGLTEIQVPNGKKDVRLINAAILDYEHSFDRKYAAMIGVDLSKLLVLTPVYAEEGFSLAEPLLEAGLQMLVVDSVGMLVSASEEDKDYDDNEKIGAEAKALGRFLKRANGLLDLADGLMVVINHYRSNLNKMGNASDKKPYGARIMQYAVKATIKVARTQSKNGRGSTDALIEKTKFGPEGLKTHFDIVFGSGIDYAGHTLTLAQRYGIIQKTGNAWFEYEGVKANGLENAAEKYPMDEITARVKQALEHVSSEDIADAKKESE